MFVNLPTGSGKSLIYQENGADRHTRLLRFVAFVHLPFSFRSLDLFGFVFLKGTSCCVVRRIFKLIKFSYVINMKSPEIKLIKWVIVILIKRFLCTVFYMFCRLVIESCKCILGRTLSLSEIPVRVFCCIQSRCLKEKNI